MKITNNFTFFFTEKDVFSQWYRCQFTITDITFCCMEQYMMWQKAKIFCDEITAIRILATTHPRDHKALGRQVTNFDDAIWNSINEKIVYEGNKAKFIQNPDLLKILLDTDGTELVEASPYDRIWGVGLSINDPKILNRANWRGQNKLGRVLTRLRNDLLAA